MNNTVQYNTVQYSTILHNTVITIISIELYSLSGTVVFLVRTICIHLMTANLVSFNWYVVEFISWRHCNIEDWGDTNNYFYASSFVSELWSHTKIPLIVVTLFTPQHPSTAQANCSDQISFVQIIVTSGRTDFNPSPVKMNPWMSIK